MAVENVTQFRSNFDITHPITDHGAKIWLAANTELTWTVPGEATQNYRAHFTFASDAEIWVKVNGTIVVPVVGTVVDSYMEEMNPENRYVKGGDVLHLISTAARQVGISLLSLPN